MKDSKIIPEIIDLLQMLPFYGGSEYIEIAKGKYEYVDSIKTGLNKIKRVWLSRKK